MFTSPVGVPPPDKTPPPSHQLDRESASPSPTTPSGPEFVFPSAKHASLDWKPPRDAPRGYITTTSPRPLDIPPSFWSLTSQHQRGQGFYPSLNSMFSLPPERQASLFVPSALQRFPTPEPPQNRSISPSKELRMDNIKMLNTPIPLPPPPALSPEKKIPTIYGPHIDHDLRRAPSRPINRRPDFRTLVLPHEALTQFLTIAEPYTLMNEEMSGLLLAKEVGLNEMSLPSSMSNSTPRGSSWRDTASRAAKEGSNLVVTTLLIPKQRDVGHMSLMDEEELVLSITEENDLVPVGWIHTHPSQSCFMTSIDLHTQSRFQRVVPEAIAVVCAPNSNPNFGIFRLTDPPGLQTVLDCTSKTPFHPHPDLPIYTEADKGHVFMRDSPLEVINFRT